MGIDTVHGSITNLPDVTQTNSPCPHIITPANKSPTTSGGNTSKTLILECLILSILSTFFHKNWKF